VKDRWAAELWHNALWTVGGTLAFVVILMIGILVLTWIYHTLERPGAVFQTLYADITTPGSGWAHLRYSVVDFAPYCALAAAFVFICGFVYGLSKRRQRHAEPPA
jgi:ABC-type nitrate/sulfonate/bicarbonate transport system permease component